MEEWKLADTSGPPAPRWWRQARLTVAAVLVGWGVAGYAHAQLNADEEARLARGEVVAHIIEERGPGGRLRAAIDIPAPASIVWRVMLDCGRAPAYVPGLEACTVLEAAADGRGDIREHRVRWIGLLPPLTLRFRSEYVPEREIRVTRIGGDLAAMQGVWRLEPREQGRATRLRAGAQRADDMPKTSARFRPLQAAGRAPCPARRGTQAQSYRGAL